MRLCARLAEGAYRSLLRMPQELRAKLTDAAGRNGSSLKAEIVRRPEVSLEPVPAREERPASRFVNKRGNMTYSRGRITVVAAVALVLVSTAAVAGRLAA